MDPLACYNEMVDLLNDKNVVESKEKAKELKEWLDKGGFYPRVSTFNEHYNNECVDRMISIIISYKLY